MKLLARVIRLFSFSLVTSGVFYFPGMLLIRLGRKLRVLNFKRNNVKSEDFQEIKVFSNVRLQVDASAYMGGSLFWTGLHHVNEIIYLNKILKRKDVFIDVGANQGEFSMFAASRVSEGKVIAFEPVKYQLNLLKNNLKLNGFRNCEIHEFGLSNENAQLPIYTSNDSELHAGIHEGLSSLFPSGDVNEEQQIIDIKVFDEIITPTLERFDFLKIDIEGAELYALKGMRVALEKFKPQILIEMNDRTFRSAGYSLTEMFDFLSELNYKPFRIHRGHLVSVSGVEQLTDWGNYIFK